MKYFSVVLTIFLFNCIDQAYAQFSSPQRIEHSTSVEAGSRRLRIASALLNYHGRANFEIFLSGRNQILDFRSLESNATYLWFAGDPYSSPNIDYVRSLAHSTALGTLDDLGGIGTSIRWMTKGVTGDVNEADFLEFITKNSIRGSILIDLLTPTVMGDGTLSSKYAYQYKPPSSTQIVSNQIVNSHTQLSFVEAFEFEAMRQKEFDQDEIHRIERFERYEKAGQKNAHYRKSNIRSMLASQ